MGWDFRPLFSLDFSLTSLLLRGFADVLSLIVTVVAAIQTATPTAMVLATATPVVPMAPEDTEEVHMAAVVTKCQILVQV